MQRGMCHPQKVNKKTSRLLRVEFSCFRQWSSVRRRTADEQSGAGLDRSLMMKAKLGEEKVLREAVRACWQASKQATYLEVSGRVHQALFGSAGGSAWQADRRHECEIVTIRHSSH